MTWFIRLLTPLTVGLLCGCSHVQADRAQPRPLRSEPTVHEIRFASARPLASPLEDPWVKYRDHDRALFLQKLGIPLLECAAMPARKLSDDCNHRRSTFEVAHALTALYRLTQDETYIKAAAKSFNPRWAMNPREALRLDPYSAAWFLAFSLERELALQPDDMRSTATAVAERLMVHLERRDEHQLAEGILFGTERNIPWMIVNLWRWAEHTDNPELMAKIKRFSDANLLRTEMDSWCPLPVDNSPERSEFLPPCLNRARAVLEITPEAITDRWLSEFAGNQGQLTPLKRPAAITHERLNFTRSWGLWTIFASTGKDRFRTMYVDHINAQMQTIERDEVHGKPLGLAVAAVGVYAMSLSFDAN